VLETRRDKKSQVLKYFKLEYPYEIKSSDLLIKTKILIVKKR